jgi:hypothetical protein
MPYKRIEILAALLLFAAPWLPGQQSLPVSPTLLERPVCPDIGSRLEIFVDYYLIDGLKGTRLKLHHPRRAEVILRGDRPWEGEHGFGQDVLLDDGKYHLYYHSGGRMCYAESPDGVRWTKPSLGLIQYDGSRENNLVGTAEGEELYDHETEPSARFFLDWRPGVPAGERFKALKLNEGERANPTEKELARKGTLDDRGFWVSGPTDVIAFVSGDGKVWRKLREEPILRNSIRGKFDGDYALFWSEIEKQYLIYTRYHTSPNRSVGRRSIGRLTSPDFLNWSRLEPMSFGDDGIIPENHLYINKTQPYYRAPHIYLAFPARLMEGRQALTDGQVREAAREAGISEERWKDCSETVLMTTRGGTRYDITFREGFIRPGPGAVHWKTRTNYALQGVVPTGENEMSMYVTRAAGTPSWHVVRYVLRVDGFASVNAPYSGGEMVTRLFTFSGRELVLNYSTSAAGSIRVEIQGPSGKLIPGYGLEDSTEIIGDEIERVVAWKKGADVSSLAGQPVRLRFAMKDADLYSLRFR